MKMRKVLRVAGRVALVGAAFSLYTVPAYASTTNGTATVTTPSLTPLSSGGSSTPFTLSLPSGASCTGDSQNGNYHVYSYLVQQGVSPGSITINSGLPSTGYGLFSSAPTYY